MSRSLAVSLALLTCAAPALAQGELPARPEQIEFPTLDFTPPDPSGFRHEIDGVVVFLAPSRELPLIDLNFTFLGGAYLDPEGLEGLTSSMGTMIRRGGTQSIKAQELDEKLDFLALQVGTGAGEYRVSATLNTLSRNLDPALELFMDMLRNPGFQADRLQLYKDEVLESLKQRNDSADSILSREWGSLVYGPTSFKGRSVTQASLAAIDEAKLRGVHALLVNPANLVISATGDFEIEPMLAKLKQALAGWERGDALAPVPVLENQPAPGVYYVQKDIPQGKVHIGMRGVKRDDPDMIPLRVMSLILGSGGFTSRITNRVRTEEGLAYSAGAGLIPGIYFPGEFRATFQSKSRTCALAMKLILEEVSRIREEPVNAEELAVAKNSVIETFPETFGSKAATVGVFVDDLLTGRDPAFWASFRDKVRAVTVEDVMRVAKKHLDPAKMAILVVGNWEEIAQGDLDGRATMAQFGEPTQLPLRDPLTLEPLN